MHLRPNGNGEFPPACQDRSAQVTLVVDHCSLVLCHSQLLTLHHHTAEHLTQARSLPVFRDIGYQNG
jgi:hypothetical protein